MGAQTDKVLNTIRGKNLVGIVSQDDIWLLFEHIDAMEVLLDDLEMDETFGDGGWRSEILHH